MPLCTNCGATVSSTYERVVSADDRDGVRACPNCPDKVRFDGKIRDARSAR